jgi:hypothetical protein
MASPLRRYGIKTRKMRGGSQETPFFIEHKTNSPRTVSGVPLNIYQSWTTNKLPMKMKENMEKLIGTNPEFDHYLYSHEKCLEFIRDNYSNDVAEAFEALKPGAYKSDLWRYCILYKLGGVYLDMKFYLTTPLLSLVKEHPELYIKDIVAEGTNDNVLKCKKGPAIYNGFIITTPRNPIFKECIDTIVMHCKARNYKNSSLSITGPCLLGGIIQMRKGKTFIKNNLFHFVGVEENGITMGNVVHGRKTIVKQYPEYRNEQANSKIIHYTNSWRKRNVYKGGTRRQRGGGKAVVFTLTNAAGFGSVVHFLTQAYINAKKTGASFFIENRDWQYGKWEDYFKSLKKFDGSDGSNVTHHQHSSQIQNYTIADHRDAIKEIFVLNDDLMKKAKDFENTIGGPYKAIYVRRGDKIRNGTKEMDAINLPDLIKTTDISGGDNLFVMTDDYAVVEEIKGLLPGVKISTMTQPNDNGANHKYIKSLNPSDAKENANELFISMQVFIDCSKGWVDNRSNLGRFMKLATPEKIALYPEDPTNKDIALTTMTSPGFKPLRDESKA